MSENRDEYNRFGLIAFLFSMVFCFAFFFYVSFIHPGVDLNENLQVPQAKDLLAEAVDVSKIEEPWVANADMVKHGQKVYAQNCAMCHGDAGLGNGPAGQALNPKPRNLVEGPWKKGGGFIGWFDVTTNGLPGTSMAAFGHIAVKDRWAVVQYIDSITNAKVKEDAAKVAAFGKTAK